MYHTMYWSIFGELGAFALNPHQVLTYSASIIMLCCVLFTILVSVVAAVAVAHRELLLCYKEGWMRIAHSQSPAQHKEL